MRTHVPTIDLGTSYANLEDYYRQSGYWGSEELRRQYACTLSPAAYVLSPRQRHDLDDMAVRIHRAVVQLNDRLCTIAGSSHIPPKDGRFLRLAAGGTRGLLRPLDQERRVPPVLKVDLVADKDGRFGIAEVDVYNPRGYGFSALLEESLPEALRSNRYPGIKRLAELLGTDDARIWYLVVSEHERFYADTFEILARSLVRFQIDVRVVRESALADGSVSIPTGAGVLAIPATLHQCPGVRDSLLARYREGDIHLFYPPVAYLESKAFLPHLRDEGGLGEYMPSTCLIGRNCPEPDDILCPEDQYVLKAAVSSGMKGVLFSDADQNDFEAQLTIARQAKVPGWILQKQVPQVPLPIVVFDQSGKRTVQDYYLRIIMYATANGVLDVDVTGRPDRKVHGAPDCIQLPTIF